MKWGLSCLKTGAAVPLKEVQNIALIGASIVHVDSNLRYANETNDPIEANFTFPLDTGSAVYRFEAEIDGRVIVAECQEKQQARETYDEAIKSGHTAVLLEEHDDTNDIFVCRLGNLPALQAAVLKICYVSELPHDPDGSLRFTLPTVLNPRYGIEHNTGLINTTTDVICVNPGSYAMSLDVIVQSHTKIVSILSSRDQLSVTFENNQHTGKANVRYAPGVTVDHDISLLVKYENMHQPQAIVERGARGQDPGLVNLDTLMISFLPEIDQKFTRSNGEYIFIVDRSGSMAYDNKIENARDTLLLMLKSLPIGCYFNIYSFGSYFHVLFDSKTAGSVEYNEWNLGPAVEFVTKMDADMGGTEILKPLEDLYSRPCLQDHPRQVIFLTDGQVWNTHEVLGLVRKHAKTTRMFSVGIGEGASTALVKGLARVGKGRAEFVKGNDRLQSKVVSLLKSAMQPMVTNVSIDLELPADVVGTTVPRECPTIFSGEELLVYAILKGSESMDIIQGNIVLRGQIENQQFEHKLGFQGQYQQGKVDTSLPVHRLAAKALIQELEDDEMSNNNIDQKTKDENKNKIILSSTSSNVVSRYTAFVGVDKKSKVPIPLLQQEHAFGGAFFGAAPRGMFGAKPISGGGGGGLFGSRCLFGGGMSGSNQMSSGVGMFGSKPVSGGGMFGSKPVSGGGMFGAKPLFGEGTFGSNQMGSGGGMFGAKPLFGEETFGSNQMGSGGGMFGAKPLSGEGTFGSNQMGSGGGMFGANSAPGGGGIFDSASFGGGFDASVNSFHNESTKPTGFSLTPTNLFVKEAPGNINTFGAPPQQTSQVFGGFSEPQSNQATPLPPVGMTELVIMQSFDGSWKLDGTLARFFQTSVEILQRNSPIQNLNIWATCLALAWLHLKEALNKQEWVMIENKAIQWLKSEGLSEDDVQNVFSFAQDQLKKI